MADEPVHLTGERVWKGGATRTVRGEKGGGSRGCCGCNGTSRGERGRIRVCSPRCAYVKRFDLEHGMGQTSPQFRHLEQADR